MTAATILKPSFDRKSFADAGAMGATLQPDEPIFCFSADELTARARQFIDNFPGHVSYAVKCNPSHEVLATLAAAGITEWDVASVHEMKAVAAAQANSRFHYHNPVKSRREIEEAYRSYGCRRFAVDCREEVQKIHDVVGADPTVELAVRLVLPRERGTSAHDFSTKFGAPEHIAIELLQQVQALGYVPVLTFHPGSQSKEPQVYVRHIEAAARIARNAGVTVGKLNVGGGFPANYELSTAPEPEVFFRAIEQAVVRAFGDTPPALECEPGRGIVATCMSLLARIKLVCTDGDDIFINDGVYGGLMEFMQVPDLKPPYRVFRDGKEIEGRSKSWKVFGPTCDPLDVLPHRLDLHEGIREGDFIEFGTLGAYGLATATRFNGYGQHQVVAVDRVLEM
ncbi:MAG: type III PLP-dependent enzyme [Proteobacteria bacterium]|nr:type III PLP-dependent enzyme [Pseudomonadota bacterium]